MKKDRNKRDEENTLNSNSNDIVSDSIKIEDKEIKKKNKVKRIFSTKEISLIAVFVAIMAVLSQIAIPIPFSPAPISFGLVAVYISGILLIPKHAVYVQICYLLLGTIGVPVFGGFRGGISALIGPTGGYLITYPIMAWIVAFSLNSRKSLVQEQAHKKIFVFIKATFSMILAHIVLYTGGTLWLSISTNTSFISSLKVGALPFIPLDVIKIAFCAVFIVPIRMRLKSSRLLMLQQKKQATPMH